MKKTTVNLKGKTYQLQKESKHIFPQHQLSGNRIEIDKQEKIVWSQDVGTEIKGVPLNLGIRKVSSSSTIFAEMDEHLELKIVKMQEITITDEDISAAANRALENSGFRLQSNHRYMLMFEKKYKITEIKEDSINNNTLSKK